MHACADAAGLPRICAEPPQSGTPARESVMPFVGLVHLAIAAFFGVHAIRSGQPMYWLFILFAFPLLK